MKGYVYVVLENRSNNWSSPGDYDYGYYNRIVGIYEDFASADSLMSRWIKTWEKNPRFRSYGMSSGMHTIIVEPEEIPEDVDPGTIGGFFEETFIRRIEPYEVEGM